MKLSTCLLFLVIAGAAIGCTGNTSRMASQPVATPAFVTVDTVYSGTQCHRAGSEEKISWLSSADHLERFYIALQRNTLGGTPIVPPVVDFNRFHLLLIEMGQRPTLGYRLMLNNAKASVDRDTVEIVLEWIEPPQGMMVGQMMTSPCLLLKLEQGGYQTLNVIDTQERHRMRVAVP